MGSEQSTPNKKTPSNRGSVRGSNANNIKNDFDISMYNQHEKMNRPNSTPSSPLNSTPHSSPPSSPPSSPVNLCVKCKRNMGSMNPRQLCGKTHCLYDSSSDELSSDESSHTTNKLSSCASSDISSLNKQDEIAPNSIAKLRSYSKGKVQSSAPTVSNITRTNSSNLHNLRNTSIGVTTRSAARKKRQFNEIVYEPEVAVESESEVVVESESEVVVESESEDIIESESEVVVESESEDIIESDESGESGENENDATNSPLDEDEAYGEKTVDEYITEQLNPEKLNLFNEEHIKLLSQSQEYIESLTPTIPQILAIAEKNNLPIDLFSDVIERIIILTNIPRLSVEYIDFRESINIMIQQLEELSKEQVMEYMEMKTQSSNNAPTIKQILESNTSREEKLRMIKILEKSQTIPTMYGMEKLNVENGQTQRLKYFNTATKEAVSIIEECETIMDNNIENQLALIREHFAPNIFANILSELKQMRNASSDNDDGFKIKQWLKYVLKLPYKTKDLPVTPNDDPEIIAKFIQQAKEKLNKYISGMDIVKEQILDFMLARIHNPKSKRNIYGLESSPGMGKSTIAKAIADCLDLPLIEIRIGGQHDISVIKGHSRTYIDAIPGQIVSKLCSVEYKNPIIFFDEIDKASSRNNEIGGALCEIFDPDQNFAFDDHYMGFPIDLSGCLMIAAMNDSAQVNSIAIDRIQILKIPDYTNDEKITMALTHLIPSALKNLNITGVEFTREAAAQILRKSKIKEKGVRQYIRNIDNILKKIIKMKLERSGIFAQPEQVNKVSRKKAKRALAQPLIPNIVVDKALIDALFWEPAASQTESMQHMYI